ncbi:MAG: ribosome-associated translation inhibitor RaiA [Candidatus Omnitrophica bacterium]|nr:ribosome-associated translation inhibitor RaiA [Candidatus Omnitrophota bacterium]
MQITVVGRHFDVTEPIKKYADSKLFKFEKYTDKIIEAHVMLEVQKFRHMAEITLFLKDFKLTSREESRDMYASIDAAVNSLHKQLLKLRERIKEHKGKRAVQKLIEPLLPKDRKKKVIERLFPTKPMSVDEACLELDLFKDNFLVFRNSDTEEINVIYKREDGNYGLIVPA